MSYRTRALAAGLLPAALLLLAACGPKKTQTAAPAATPAAEPLVEEVPLVEDEATDEELGSPFPTAEGGTGAEQPDPFALDTAADSTPETGSTADDDLFAEDVGGEDDLFAGDAGAEDPFATDSAATATEDDFPFAEEVPAAEASSPPAAASGPCELATVYFDFDSAVLRPEAKAALDEVGTCMKADRAMKIRIEGHCDERGTRAYNYALGSRRANAVRRYLVAIGVGANRVQTKSYGEDRPAARGSGEDVWQQNRRAEFSDRGRGVVILWGDGTGHTFGTRLDLGNPVWGTDRSGNVSIGDPVWQD